MAQTFTLNATHRSESGKNAMRRLRKAGNVPGIVFGRSGETTPVSFNPKELLKILHSDSGFNTIFTLNVEGADKPLSPMVIVKEYQLEPVTHNFLHVSFYRVRMDRLMEVEIPIQVVGISPGVKNEGGTLDLVMREIEVRCLPADIPEHITVDISNLHMNDTVRVKDLDIPEKVEVLEEEEGVVLHISPPKKVVEVVETEGEGEAAGEKEESQD